MDYKNELKKDSRHYLEKEINDSKISEGIELDNTADGIDVAITNEDIKKLCEEEVDGEAAFTKAVPELSSDSLTLIRQTVDYINTIFNALDEGADKSRMINHISWASYFAEKTADERYIQITSANDKEENHASFKDSACRMEPRKCLNLNTDDLKRIWNEKMTYTIKCLYKALDENDIKKTCCYCTGLVNLSDIAYMFL